MQDIAWALSADVCRVIDREAQAALSPANRVRMIWASLMRIGELQEAGDVASGALCVKLDEREATLISLNAPLKVDPIELAESVRPQLTSTETVLAAIYWLKAGNPKRKMNGGAGYGDERDDEDEKLTRLQA